MKRLMGCVCIKPHDAAEKPNPASPGNVVVDPSNGAAPLAVATVDKSPTASSSSMALESPAQSNPLSAPLCYGTKVDPLHLEGRLPPIKTPTPTPPPFSAPKRAICYVPLKHTAPRGQLSSDVIPARYTVVRCWQAWRASHTPYSHLLQVRDIGVGMYGQVVLAFDRELDEYVAIKMIPRGRSLSKMMEREIFSHRTCSAHPHVIAFHRIFLTKRCVD